MSVNGGKSLVIVESPTKAKTIGKFLGKDFVVKASMGHIRDLPNNASEIPTNLKKEAWAKLGVNIANGFEPLYIIPPKKRDHVKGLKEALKDASVVYLATDEDREGESISWHLVEALKPKVPTKRLVFHEITNKAIDEALRSPRAIDENLVRAQETRRIVDRLFGYEVSPLLWKKLGPRLSAGRVQSVAIRLLVERERARVSFRKAVYWGLKAKFKKIEGSSQQSFEAEFTHIGGKRLAQGKDFDAATGKLKAPEEVALLNQQQALEIRDRLARGDAIVQSVEEKPYSSSPPAPFVTSTLQQESNLKLRFSAKHTMNVAQQLYENGFITYMRTDSTTLSEEGLNGARTFIKREYGDNYLPKAPRLYATKVKNAQEAHEAIRPAGAEFTPMELVKTQLGDDAFRLYELIWKRTVASQMENARGMNIAVQIGIEDAQFRASGKTIEFPGFLRAYVEGSDDPDAEIADREKSLPKLQTGEHLGIEALEEIEHTTQPPARFTEGSLIKELERLGIGRPSTWATIVDLVLSRSYAFKKGTALVPTFIAIAVVGMLETHFRDLLDYEFTARLEDDLDAISRGEAQNLNYLKEFYYGNGHPGLRPLVEKGETDIDPRQVCGIPIGTSQSGDALEVRIGRFGPFLSNGTVRVSLSDTLALEELTVEKAQELIETAQRGPEPLGTDPVTGLLVYLKVGPYGPYVQLGENNPEQRPKMASLLAGMLPAEMNLETALKLLSLPRNLGPHPETKEDVIAANGRFGPYIKCGAETRSIPADQFSPLEITIEQAVELLKQPKGRGRSQKPKVLRELGAHPSSGDKLVILSGKYGPYVSDGSLNASLPKGLEPEALTITQAVDLLAARAEKGPVKKRGKKGKKKAAAE